MFLRCCCHFIASDVWNLYYFFADRPTDFWRSPTVDKNQNMWGWPRIERLYFKNVWKNPQRSISYFVVKFTSIFPSCFQHFILQLSNIWDKFRQVGVDVLLACNVIYTMFPENDIVKKMVSRSFFFFYQFFKVTGSATVQFNWNFCDKFES